MQTTFVLRLFEIRGADISARSLKVKKNCQKTRFFSVFPKKVQKFPRNWLIFLVFLMNNSYLNKIKSICRIQYCLDVYLKPGWSWLCLGGRLKKKNLMQILFRSFEWKNCILSFLKTFVLQLFRYFSFSWPKSQKIHFLKKIFFNFFLRSLKKNILSITASIIFFSKFYLTIILNKKN